MKVTAWIVVDAYGPHEESIRPTRGNAIRVFMREEYPATFDETETDCGMFKLPAKYGARAVELTIEVPT